MCNRYRHARPPIAKRTSTDPSWTIKNARRRYSDDSNRSIWSLRPRSGRSQRWEDQKTAKSHLDRFGRRTTLELRRTSQKKCTSGCTKSFPVRSIANSGSGGGARGMVPERRAINSHHRVLSASQITFMLLDERYTGVIFRSGVDRDRRDCIETRATVTSNDRCNRGIGT